MPVVTYEQVTASLAARPSATMFLQLTPSPLQFLLYLVDMVVQAGGTPDIGFLDMQGMNAVISCTEWKRL